MKMSATGLLDLQPQDKVVIANLGYGQYEECMYYVECVDLDAAFIHVLSASGNSMKVRAQDVLDIQKSIDPVMVMPDQKHWVVGGCDPDFLGKPVRALAVSVSNGNRLTGVVVPKWPGRKPGTVVHVAGTAMQFGLDETGLLSRLPSYGFNTSRMGDPEKLRKRTMRTARGRIAKWLAAGCNPVGKALPLDPSLKRRAGLLLDCAQELPIEGQA